MKNNLSSSGFTLVEMLVSIVLSSIIFVSAYQVINNLVQYQVRAKVKYDHQIDVLLLRNMLSNIIEKSIHQNEMYHRAQKIIIFKGGEDSIQLISRAFSDHFDSPGYRVYSLYLKKGELYVSYRKYDGNYVSNQRFELSSGLIIEDISFSYFSDEDGWVDVWQDIKQLPQYVQVEISLPNNDDLIFVRETGKR